jgi:hypothetical protein
MSLLWRASQCAVVGLVFALSGVITAKAEQQSDTATAQAQTSASSSAAPSVVIPPAPSVDDDPNWHFQSLVYLWFPGMHGTVGAHGLTASTHISPADLLKNLNFGLMGAFEADYKRWGIPVDFIWAKLRDKHAFPNIPNYALQATVKQGILTPKVSYLVLDGRKAKVRATAGVRYWYASSGLQFTPKLTNLSFTSSQSWADVVAGANIAVPLSPKLSVVLLGDAGAGAANLDYQVGALANYQIKPKLGLGLGYRYLDVNYRNSNKYVNDVVQSGIVLTLLYKFGKPAN